MSSNSSRRNQNGPITGISGMGSNGTPIATGEPMNGFGLNGPSIGSSGVGSNGLQTMSSIG